METGFGSLAAAEISACLCRDCCGCLGGRSAGFQGARSFRAFCSRNLQERGISVAHETSECIRREENE